MSPNQTGLKMRFLSPRAETVLELLFVCGTTLSAGVEASNDTYTVQRQDRVKRFVKDPGKDNNLVVIFYGFCDVVHVFVATPPQLYPKRLIASRCSSFK